MFTKYPFYKIICLVLVIIFSISLRGCLPIPLPLPPPLTHGFSARVSPSDLAEEVALNTQIVIQFDKPVNRQSLDASALRITDTRTSNLVIGEISLTGGGQTATFTPHQPWREDTFYLVQINNIRDRNGIYLDADLRQPGIQPIWSSFRTSAGDRRGPRVIRISPAEFSIITGGGRITIDFDEPIQSETINQEKLRLFDDKGNFIPASSISTNTDGRVIYNLSNSSIKDGTRYTLTLVPDILDLNGNTMNEAFVAHFIGKAMDHTLPGMMVPPPPPAIGQAPSDAIRPGDPLKLGGTGKPGNYVKVLWDNIDVFPRGIMVSPSGQWKMTLPAPPIGKTVFTAIQFDQNGRASVPSSPVSISCAPTLSHDNVIFLTAGVGYAPAFRGEVKIQTELPGQLVIITTSGGRGVEQPARGWVNVEGEEVSFTFGDEPAGPFQTDEEGTLSISISPSDMVEEAVLTAQVDGQVLQTFPAVFDAPFLSVTQAPILVDGESTTMAATVRGLGYNANGDAIGIAINNHHLQVQAKPLNPVDLPFIGIAVEPPGGSGPEPDEPLGVVSQAHRSDACGTVFAPPPSTQPDDPSPSPSDDGPSNLMGHLPFDVTVAPGAPSGNHPQFQIELTDFSVFLPDGSHPVFVTETKNAPVPSDSGTELEPTGAPFGNNVVAIAEPAQNSTVGTTRERPRPVEPTPGDGDETTEGEPEPEHPNPDGDPVFLHSGEFQVRETDLRVPSRGFDWTFTRTYKSRISYNGPLGHNWDFNQNMRVAPTPGQSDSLTWYTGFGRALIYIHSGQGRYRSPNGHYDQLTIDTSTRIIRIRQRSGRKLFFHPLSAGYQAGKVERIVDRNGNTMRFFYDLTTGHLVYVRDTLSRTYTYSYNDQGRLSAVTDFSGRQIQFRYDVWGNLVEARSPVVIGSSTGNDFPDGRIIRYTYSRGFPDERLNHNLLTVTDPNEVANSGPPWVVNCYDANPKSFSFDRVIQQDVGGLNHSGVPAGGTYLYTYFPINEGREGLNLPKLVTIVTDRIGNIHEYRFNAQGNVVEELQHANRNVRPKGPGLAEDPHTFITTYLYNTDGQRIVSIFPEGNRIESFYGTEDNNRNGILDAGGDANSDGDFLDPEDTLPEDRNGNGILDEAPRFAQGNLLELRRIADPTRGGGSPLIERYSYEPIYNRLRTVIDERENSPAFTPQNGGVNSPGRYTTTYFFDYQEGMPSAVLPPLAAEMGMSVAEVLSLLQDNGISLGFGDLNGDGRIDQASGNMVKMQLPTVALLLEQKLSVVANGGMKQEVVCLFTHNEFGQLVFLIDPEQNRTKYSYYSEADPDGDGDDQNPLSLTNCGKPFAANMGGYLKEIMEDIARAPGRNSSTDPQPTHIRTRYRYDRTGNVTGLIDGRGILHTYEVNALNEIVRSTIAANTTAFLNPAESGSVTALHYETEFRYDANGNLEDVRVENAGEQDGTPDRLASNPFWTTRYVYDILDNPVTQVQEVEPIEKEDLVLLTEPGVIVSRYEYDVNENRIKFISPKGNSISFLYDERNLVFSITKGTDTVDVARSFVHYDNNGNTIAITDAEDNGTVDPQFGCDATIFTLDGFNRIIAVHDAADNSKILQYDPASRLVRELFFGPPSDGSLRLAEIEYFFDELGRNFRTDHRIFDNPGGNGGTKIPTVAESILPGNPSPNTEGEAVYWYEYDRNSRLVRTVEPDGDDILVAYDGANRSIELLSAPVTLGGQNLRNIQRWSYDDNSNLIQVVEIDQPSEPLLSAKTFITDYVYDATNRAIRATDNLGQTVRSIFDSRSNLIIFTDAKGPSITDPLGLFPGSRSMPSSTTINNHGNIMRLYYDGINRLIRRERLLQPGGIGDGTLDADSLTSLAKSPANPDGIIREEYRWNKNSRLIAEFDDNNNVTTHVYDAQHRCRITRSQDGTRMFYYLDRDSNLVRLVDRNGSATTKTYDDINRPFSLEVARAEQLAGTSALVEGTTKQSYIWDGLSRLVEASDNNDPIDASDDSRFIRRYDSLDRLIEEIQSTSSLNHQIEMDFASDGNRIAFQFPSGRRVTTRFDGENRPIVREEGLPTAARDNDIVHYWYIGNERVYKRYYGNGVTCRIAYDGVRRITKLEYQQAGNGILITGHAYDYDRAHNRKFQQHLHAGGTNENYSYDSANRLVKFVQGVPTIDLGNPSATGSAQVSYNLDGVDNRVEVTSTQGNRFAYNSPNGTYQFDNCNEYYLITQENGTSLHRIHDNNGNLIDDGERIYNYDFLNRLVSVHRKSNGQLIARYAYDALMRRVSRAVSEPTPTAIRYIWDGWQIIEERDEADSILAQYVYGNYIDEIIQIRCRDTEDLDGDSNRDELIDLYCHQDAIFSVAALSDATGQAVERFDYDSPYGVLSAQHPVSLLAFQGLRIDPETTLYYARLRQYDPFTGRFVQRDPIGTLGLMNLYQFGNSSPTNFSDPMGMDSTQLIKDMTEIMDIVNETDITKKSEKMADFIASKAPPIVAGQATIITEHTKNIASVYRDSAGIIDEVMNEDQSNLRAKYKRFKSTVRPRLTGEALIKKITKIGETKGRETLIKELWKAAGNKPKDFDRVKNLYDAGKKVGPSNSWWAGVKLKAFFFIAKVGMWFN